MGFRHLLQAHDLTKAVLVEINVMLMERGLLMSQVSLVDATLIAAPSPTKNKDHARDKEMHQTNKGNQWHFGMKAHIAVDKHSGLVHTVVSTQADVSDVSQAQALLHGQDSDVWAEAQSSKLKCGRMWSTHFTSSRTPSGTKRLATTAWQKTMRTVKNQ
jgi:transposase, IS5 family